MFKIDTACEGPWCIDLLSPPPPSLSICPYPCTINAFHLLHFFTQEVFVLSKVSLGGLSCWDEDHKDPVVLQIHAISHTSITFSDVVDVPLCVCLTVTHILSLLLFLSFFFLSQPKRSRQMAAHLELGSAGGFFGLTESFCCQMFAPGRMSGLFK